MSMPSIDDKHETEEEDMEQETPETDKSEDEDSETGTGSEEEEDESSGKWSWWFYFSNEMPYENCGTFCGYRHQQWFHSGKPSPFSLHSNPLSLNLM